MTQSETHEYRAKITEVGGLMRGWIPSKVAKYLKARGGDYMIFRRDETGKVTVTVRHPTPSEKRKAMARLTRKA